MSVATNTKIAPVREGTDPTRTFTALLTTATTWAALEEDRFRSMDWNALLESASYHGLVPVLAQRVLESQIKIPLEIRERLRSCFEQSMLRSFPHVQEILRIAEEFSRNAIPIVPYKGPVLAEQLWGSFSLRVCADLDFLVRAEHVDRAGDLLENLGYERIASVPRHLRAALVRNASEEQFRHRQTGLLLELQWSPAPRVFALRYDVKAFWQRARTIEFAGSVILAPSHEDLLLLLCVHGWKHNWSRLLWVGDLAQLLRSQLDWDYLFRCAQQQRITGILQLGLHIAHELFAAALPPICIVTPAPIQKPAQRLIELMKSNQPCTYFEWHKFMLAARDSSVERTKQVARFLFTPGLGEYAALDLPGWASPGYSLVRLARVAGLLRGKAKE